MSKNPVLYKSLVVGVIVIFIGIGIQPAIATVEPNTSDNDFDYYDVNIEFCGLGKNITVQLTKQQLDELYLLFDTIREQLNNTESIEETIKIYNEAIVELDNLGMLGGCDVRQVQELVTGEYQKQGFIKLLDRMIDKNQLYDEINIFCLIAGWTTQTMVLPPSTMAVYGLFIFMNILRNYNFYFGFFLILYSFIRLCLTAYFPLTFTIGSGITLGIGSPFGGNPKPASGWVETIGYYGLKEWEGRFLGRIWTIALIGTLYLGVIGFKGIRIRTSKNENTYFYLGFANYVNI